MDSVLQPGAETPLLSGIGLRLSYSGVAALDNVSLSLRRGEIVTLVGPNGSGKTSLVRLLLELQEPDEGRIEREPGIRIGYVPQSVTIDATLPLTARRFVTLGHSAAPGDVDAALREVGAAHVADTLVAKLSGGERRRVLLARALLQDPDLLVLDEPTAGVDVPGQIALYRLIAEIRDCRQCGVLLVSHNLHLVMAATDHVVCLNRHVCCEGRPDTISRAPEYLSLFGQEAVDSLAVYSHQHDHHHDLAGEPVPDDGQDHDQNHGHGHDHPHG